MRTVHLNLKRMEGQKPNLRNLPTAGAIARRDRDALRGVGSFKTRNLIPTSRISELTEQLSIYPVGKREHVFTASVIRHDRMFTLLGIQSKIFNQWLTAGKVPYAAFSIDTGRKGHPPKAYLVEEADALVTSLNTHYKAHYTYRNTHEGLRQSIRSGMELARKRKEVQDASAR